MMIRAISPDFIVAVNRGNLPHPSVKHIVCACLKGTTTSAADIPCFELVQRLGKVPPGHCLVFSLGVRMADWAGVEVSRVGRWTGAGNCTTTLRKGCKMANDMPFTFFRRRQLFHRPLTYTSVFASPKVIVSNCITHRGPLMMQVSLSGVFMPFLNPPSFPRPSFWRPIFPPYCSCARWPGPFGPYGGSYVPETLMAAVRQLAEEYERAKKDPAFQKELDYYLKEFVGRPTPLYFAQRLTELAGGAKIYLKREDLAHTGAHKINNTLGQALLPLAWARNA